MKKTYQKWAFTGLLLLFVAMFVYSVTGEPYIEYTLTGFTSYDQPATNILAVGIATPPLFGTLVFDFAFVGQLDSSPGDIQFIPGARFYGIYGNNDTYIKIGCTIDTNVGFSPFLELKLSIPLFALWGSPEAL